MKKNRGGQLSRAAWLGPACLYAFVGGPGGEAFARPVRKPVQRGATRPAAPVGTAASGGGARAQLEQAYARDQQPAWLCRLAQLDAEAGQLLVAQDLARRCLKDARPGALPEELRQAADAMLGQPRPESGELSVFGPRRALLSVDGRLVGALPFTLPLLLGPGRHDLRLVLGGREQRGAAPVLAGRGGLVRFTGTGLALTPTATVALVVGAEASGPVAASLLGESTRVLRAQRLMPLGSYGALAQPLDPGCTSATCLNTLAQQHSLRHVLLVNGAATGSGYALGVRLFDAQVRDFAAEAQADCDGCTAEQAGARVGGMVADALRRGLHRATGILEITSVPEGGEVLLNGLSLGRTPLRHPAFAGEHVLTVNKTGFAPYTNEVVVDPGRGAAMDAVLREARDLPSEEPALPPEPSETEGAVRSAAPAPSPAPMSRIANRAHRGDSFSTPGDGDYSAPPASARQDSVRAPRPGWRIAVGATAAALGVSFIGLGAAGLWGSSTCDGVNPATCSGPEGLRAAGAPLLGGGLLLSGLGIALWAAPGDRRQN
jgi:hypothetical protein